MGWFRDFVFRLLKVKPATERRITIQEPLTFRANVLKNQIWYRGDPAELEQFFKAVANFDTDKARFWASVPYGKVRKIHSGIVGTVIDRYRDIVTADFNGFAFGEDGEEQPILERWEEIAQDTGFDHLFGEALAGALSSGDGAFKISIVEGSEYPVISFYEADSVEFIRQGQKIKEIKFYTPYRDGEKEYQLEESYGIGYVRYRLLDEGGLEVPIGTLEETADFRNVTFNGDFLMGVPVILFGSTKWKGRGKALFDTKTDNLDALDEVISQWLDAVRMGRVKRYIPDDMIPRDPDTGALLEANPFDNDFIAVGSMKVEGAQNKIDISQPQISYEAYVNSYAAFLDLVLQGIMSPSTLGIDLKKTDNAEAQREKEKVTMFVRGKIVASLDSILPLLAERTLQVYDLIRQVTPGEYEASVKFGEYASPDFDTTVQTVAQAKAAGVMSIEQSIEELYGDTWSEEEKAEEVRRLKEEQGIVSLDEPSEGMDGSFPEEDENGEMHGSDRGQDLGDGTRAGAGSAPGSERTGAGGDLRAPEGESL